MSLTGARANPWKSLTEKNSFVDVLKKKQKGTFQLLYSLARLFGVLDVYGVVFSYCSPKERRFLRDFFIVMESAGSGIRPSHHYSGMLPLRIAQTGRHGIRF